jgi:glutamate 5-kinase
MTNNKLARAKRWVIKIGSALLTGNGKGLDTGAIAGWVAQMAGLREQGIEVVLVSSGAVAAGLPRLGWQERPHQLHELQAAAAVGQMGLVQTYESVFQQFGLHTAQILLVHTDLSDRGRYLNARSTLTTLLDLGVIPVVNENDTVATDEIRFGDNDTLAGLVANLVDADLLVILTDQEGLYDSDPRHNDSARLIPKANIDDPLLTQVAQGSSGGLGRGGMITKVRAAKLAARSGTSTVIASGTAENVLLRLAGGESCGSLLVADGGSLAARKQWLAGQVQTKGKLVLDDGAVNVLSGAGKSLLPVGVLAVEGQFLRGALVSCVDSKGREIARGLVNYDAAEAARIAGMSSANISQELGYQGDDELIHRDNLVIV